MTTPLGPTPTRYAVLRDGARWDGVRTTGLGVTATGALELARIPAAPRGADVDLPGPYAVEPAGIAPGRCGDLFLADPVRRRLVWLDGICGARLELPERGDAADSDGLGAPRAVLVDAQSVYVADGDNGCVHVLRARTFERRAVWATPFSEPIALARGRSGRVHVLDRARRTVERCDAHGQVDPAFSANVASQLGTDVPHALAIDQDGVGYVSVPANARVRRFAEDGSPLEALGAEGTPPGFSPGALAAHGRALVVADRTGGRLWWFDLAAGRCLGDVPGFRGPVTALAFTPSGALHVRTDFGDRVQQWAAADGCVAAGELTAGPLDAGEATGWTRAWLTGDRPAGTELELQAAVADSAAADPLEPDWIAPGSPDLLLPIFTIKGQPEPQPRRHLWLRVRLRSRDGRTSPTLQQVEAETPAEDYLQHLPAVYRSKDYRQPSADDQPKDPGFLRRWLALFRSQLDGFERALDDMPRRFNAATAPAEDVRWLASWLAFAPPADADVELQRRLLQRAVGLHRRRGTVAGLREWIELSTGLRPVIVESFRGARLWQLGHTSQLGFDTALAPLAPHGVVVPESSPRTGGDPDCADATGCAADALVIGSTVVGATGPLDAADIGEPLFAETAHHFTVWLPAARVAAPARRAALRRVLEAEKPAHTAYDLCLVEPRLRIGLQSSIGVDTLVAGPPIGAALTGTVLGLNSQIADTPGDALASRVRRRALVGLETVLD